MRKINHILLLLLLSASFLTSCHKEIVEIPDSNEPIFYATGKIGEDTINYIVGDNSTFTPSEYIVNGVHFYQGKLSNSTTELNIGFYSGNNDFADVSYDSIIQASRLNFFGLNNQYVFGVSKDYFKNYANIKEIKWYLDGQYAGTNAMKINEVGKFTLCAQITYNDLTTAELCNDILIGFKRNAVLKLEHTLDIDNQLQAWAETSEGAVSSINWYLDGNFIYNGINLNTVISSGLHTLSSDVTFTNGATKKRSILVDGSHLNRSMEDFGALENVNQYFSDYKLKIDMKLNGIDYSSSSIDNSSSDLKINSVTFYSFDQNNNPIYLIKGTLNGKVYSKVNNDMKDLILNISWGVVIK